jgi:NADH dehydrogenase FAD-containing subunit
MFSKIRKLGVPFRKYSTTDGNAKRRWGYIIGGSIGVVLCIAFGTRAYFNSRTSQMNSTTIDGEKQRVVVLGSGWASLSFISEVDTDKYDVTVISPQNYFLFTPLLPGVATSHLEFNSIIEPIRKYCQRTNSEKIHFFEASCVDIDPKQNSVTCSVDISGTNKTFPIPYDQLVVAVGAINQTFGIKGVEENCNFLKSLPDAIAIRKKIIDSFELASLSSTSEEEKQKLLNFIVVGGGPAGTEFVIDSKY